MRLSLSRRASSSGLGLAYLARLATDLWRERTISIGVDQPSLAACVSVECRSSCSVCPVWPVNSSAARQYGSRTYPAGSASCAAGMLRDRTQRPKIAGLSELSSKVILAAGSHRQ
jgi:hypothetical protein